MQVHTAFLRENSSYPWHLCKGVQCRGTWNTGW